MPCKLISAPVRFFVVAVALFAFGTELVPAASAQTTWRITIKKGSGTKPQYDVSPPPNNKCKPKVPQPGPTAEFLWVCRGDTVTWQAEQGHNEMFVFHNDVIFENGKQVFHGSNGGQTDNGRINLNANLGDHKYIVVVWNGDWGEFYGDDPKIIIGIPNPDDETLGELDREYCTVGDKVPEAQKICKAVETLTTLLTQQKRPKKPN